MRLLSIETSTALGGVAIVEEPQRLVAETRLSVRAVHSERLIPEIDTLLRRAGLKIGDIDVFSASIGPGSFTGLRIGLSTLKGLAFATKKPIVTVPTLESMAWNLPFCPYPICPLLDARKGELYVGGFLWEEDSPKRLFAETNLKVEEIAPLFKDDKIVFLGEGSEMYKDEIIKVFGNRAIFAPPHLGVLLPSSAAFLGLRKALRGEFEEPSLLRPLYIRKSEAELKNPPKDGD